jgi:hypothetical protein
MKIACSTLIGSLALIDASVVVAQPVQDAPTPTAPEAAPAPAPTTTPPPVLAPAPPAVAAAPAVPAPATPVESSPAPKSLEVGSGGGSWTPGALLQFWILASHQNMTPRGATVPIADEDTLGMRLRRAELRIKGDIVPKRIGFHLMIDPARALELTNKKLTVTDGEGTVTAAQPASDGAPLTIMQDFFVTFSSDYVDFSVGQFKIPVSMEGYGSSSKILFPERAAVSRKFGDKRDIGLRAEKKIGDHFAYSAGLFNGTGQNKLDDDTEKDAALRLEFSVIGITVAGVGYATVGKRKKSSRDRLEADIKYDANDAYVLGEYIHAWDSTGGGKALRGHGMYIEGGYTFFGHLQPILRVGELEPVVDKRGDHYMHFEGGANWLFQKHEAKLGLALAYYAPTTPTPTSNPKRTEGILAFQAAF